MGESHWRFEAPSVSPTLTNMDRDEHWKQFDNSVNAVSFGFVATAILISMFLVMAIFERFLRPNSPSIGSGGGGGGRGDVESQMGFNPKLGYPSPKMTIYSKGVSVLMPGEEIPTFIAHPAPVSCPPNRIQWHLQVHEHSGIVNPTQQTINGANPVRDPT
ncbi:hypothetical protein Droror1_Dr00010433 [Drosera rotundifolia]